MPMPYLFGFAKLLKQVQITTMVSQPKNQLFYSSENSDLSVALASCIIVLWMVSLIEAFSANVLQTFWFVTLLRILIRTFLHTGIFIVAHEAIHQNFPQHYRLNDVFGHMTSYLYALLPYPVLAEIISCIIVFLEQRKILIIANLEGRIFYSGTSNL
jgi:hypothetical protein